jgi:hypothetical protein
LRSSCGQCLTTLRQRDRRHGNGQPRQPNIRESEHPISLPTGSAPHCTRSASFAPAATIGKGQGARDAAGIAGPLSPDRYYDRLPSLAANLAQDGFTQGELVLTVQGFVADPSGRKVRPRYKAALRGSVGFTAFSSSVAALGSHAIARTHVIRNKQASPKTLIKSTANGPKAMRNRNGLTRIGFWPPKPSRTTTGPMQGPAFGGNAKLCCFR